MNFKLVDFTLKSLKRNLTKKISVIFIFTLLVFLLVSVFSISSSIKKELQISVDSLPELIVQKMSGGRQTLIPVERAFEIASIAGVNNAYDRVWGYYFFDNVNVNFTVLGLDFDLESYKQKYNDIIKMHSEIIDTTNTPFMIAGKGVVEIFEEYYSPKHFNFIKGNGDLMKTNIAGSFSDESALETNDIIIMPISSVRELFDVEEHLATDIVIRIPNP
ncbi:MAG: ABC transporter permease, partial [Ignavibacteriae bacterium]|nr:ABC transporter permease [Ignavibacteriota bacterium]